MASIFTLREAAGSDSAAPPGTVARWTSARHPSRSASARTAAEQISPTTARAPAGMPPGALSIATTGSPTASNRCTSWRPTKPPAPVTTMVMA